MNDALLRLARRASFDNPEVDVWLIALDVSAGDLRQCEELLSNDERARAARFHFERHRNRYIAGRGMLRAVLGDYLETSPATVGLGAEPHGKPALTGHPVNLHFNLAHSDELAILAVSRACVPGVDIEKRGRKIDCDALARRFFSPREYAELASLPPARRNDAFLSCWTRKEAVVKALGAGLRMPLDQIEVSVAPDAPPRLLSIPGDDVGSWSLHTIEAGRDYVATVALQRPKG